MRSAGQISICFDKSIATAPPPLLRLIIARAVNRPIILRVVGRTTFVPMHYRSALSSRDSHNDSCRPREQADVLHIISDYSFFGYHKPDISWSLGVTSLHGISAM